MKDKISIITGSGRGIGKEIAKSFASQGATVVLTSRSKTEIDSTLKEIQKNGGKGVSIPTDICKYSDVENLISKVIEKYSKIDILVNNAGIIEPIGPINKITIKDWEENIRINLLGTFYCIKTTLPHMIKNHYGKIINISGGGAFNPRPNFSAYAVSKAGVIRLTEQVAEEMKNNNISVNAISPGMIKTKMTNEIFKSGDMAGNELSDAKNVINNGGQSLENVTKLALFLASEESNGLTGKTISAQWDNLEDIKKNISSIQNSEKYTMKRIT